MSSHYLVKLEMFILHMLPLSYYRKKLHNSSHLNCSAYPPNSPDLNPVDDRM